MFDGFKDGNEHALLSAFVNTDNRALERTKRPIRLLYDEESLTSRLGLVRGFSTLNQLETVYVITKQTLNLKSAKRLHYPGTNHGNCISPVVAPAWDESAWRLGPKDKKQVLGNLGKVLVGGPSTITVEEREAAKKRARASGPDGVEPVFFHGGPVQLCEELHHSYRLHNIIDLTSGKGDWALTAMSRRVPFVGVVLSKAHREELMKYLLTAVMDAFQTEDHTLYQPSMVDAIATEKKEVQKAEKKEKKPKPGAGVQAKGDDGGGAPKPKGRGRGRGRGRQAKADPETQKNKLLKKIKALHKKGGKKEEDGGAEDKEDEEEVDEEEEEEEEGQEEDD